MTPISPGEAAADRTLWTVTGKDALGFLQGLLSNDMRPLEHAPGIVWAALLSPQGKYLADLFVVRRPEGQLLIDIATPLAADTLRRLTMYRLRSEVTFTPSPLYVHRGLGTSPEGAFLDPRHPALGWRNWVETAGTTPQIDWDAIRVAHLIPESAGELIPDETYILEAGFERLNGVDFRKGCYVGQEVVARMKHKTELRKGLARVVMDGWAPAGSDITVDARIVGRLFTQSDGHGIAQLRFDQANGVMQAGSARLWCE
jgi:tRNA-modifying protein YgfZ